MARFPTFLDAPMVSSPFKDLTETLSKGYQLGRLPERSRLEEELLRQQGSLAGTQSSLAGEKQRLIESIMGRSQRFQEAQQVDGGAQQADIGPQQPAGQSLQEMDPMTASIFKSVTGIDPYLESPEMKSRRELRDFERKEEIKRDASLGRLTPSTITQMQKEVASADDILPLFDKLIETSQNITMLGSTKDRTYQNYIAQMADKYMVAENWPNTQSAREDAKKLFVRGPTEFAENYERRMRRIQEEIMRGKRHKLDSLSSNAVAAGVTEQSNKKEYTFKGKKYMIPLEEVAGFEAWMKNQEGK